MNRNFKSPFKSIKCILAELKYNFFKYNILTDPELLNGSMFNLMFI